MSGADHELLIVKVDSKYSLLYLLYPIDISR